ncbi:diguanylate cyclase (GGDEF) domain-containing protein [Mycolicibacterium chubuense NBB4]|uniref:Diguanylate cyclase (GGDEF) domain-containing protein n=1 Tax=Mycolicibacterium chubuense (strain NBB4) TaxID=710421 RepID=I4BC60_MYCCN|nr:GGDEF domain-containing protein [Mycolicibacterium chubuense]AFM14867.1 diguanylate cyclase (GGDEF) domain-containing protein [Mycolicibacterium chubuense NBB4]
MQRLHTFADHYEWVSGFLAARGVTLRTRVFLAATALTMAIGVLVLLFGAGGPQSPAGRTMMWLAVVGGVFGSALWLWRWPSHTLSLAFTAATTVSITLACLAYPDPLAALLGCIAFTTIVGYAAFFHSARTLLALFVVVTAVAVAQAAELAAEGRSALALVDLFLVLQPSIAVALAIHSLVRTLKGDLAAADLDPLTGLLNRRAFRRQIGVLLSRHQGDGGYLLAALLDLDNFKSVNDTHGHAVGDKALTAVADALRGIATPTTLIARSGGEEFLLADLAPSHDAVLRFEDICAAIAQLPIPVTGSVGTSFTAVESLTPHAHDDVVDDLFAAADKAMYDAKHNGGNRCHHHGIWP